jgi:putative ABC transport system permease protein
VSYLARIAARSAWNRRLTLGMMAATIGLSVALLLGVERIRNDARENFAHSVSGTDLVVGARTSPVQLMLYAVFRLGEATNNIRWESFRMLAEHPDVAWAIPLALGDSHRGFPVLGTGRAYFQHFRYGRAQRLAFAAGRPFEQVFEAVVGAEVAQRLGYRQGSRIVLNHGLGEVALAQHTDKPFTVVGVLGPTGTPVDRTVHVSSEAIEALHLDWQGGAPIPGLAIPAEHVRKFDLTPKSATAVLVGLKSRPAVFRMQRFIHEYRQEPLLAVLPAVALDQLWRIVGIAERTLLAVSAMVFVAALAGLVAIFLAGLDGRRRELAILRSVGARPRDIVALLTLEGFGVTLAGALLGVVFVHIATLVFGPLVQAQYGLVLQTTGVSPAELGWLVAVLGAGLAASLIPALRACKLSLADGLTPRL